MAEGIQDLYELLMREQVLDEPTLQNAREEQERTGLSLGRVLIDRGLMQEHEKNFLLQKFFGFDLISLRNTQFDPTILGRIPLAFAQKHHVVAMGELGDGSLIVAMEDPSDHLLIKLLEDRIGRTLKPVLARRDDLLRAFKFYDSIPAESPVRSTEDEEPEEKTATGPSKLVQGLLTLIMIAPLLLLLFAIKVDLAGFGTRLTQLVADKIITNNDLCVYVGLGWMLWALLVYEIGGLITGAGAKRETEAES